uniref:Putative hexamerin 4 n=1 Tax=Panstrongylus lignarius TaxID=156445 RepID=A0A224XCH4_9HEMI
MKLARLSISFLYITILLTISSTNGERKLADPKFVLQQRQILDLYVGIGQADYDYSLNEYSDFDINANLDHFNKPAIIKEFLKAYNHGGFLQKNALFSMASPRTRSHIRKLFDLFYFANDFETFYKVASWAKKHINQNQFVYAYTLAILHRPDCVSFSIPPLYEIFPSYFTPTDLMHQVYEAKIKDIKEKKFTYNNTGYEYNYNTNVFGSPLSQDAVGHLDYKISYFREDVGLNNMYALFMLKLPSWMCPHRYVGTNLYKRGETFYFVHQQLYSRYTLARLANGLPFTERLQWELPIKVGYNPRVAHFNGLSFHTRPDNLIPDHFKKEHVTKAQLLEKRILDVIDSAVVWDTTNTTLLPIDDENGLELLSQLIYGTTERPNRKYFPSYYWHVIETLGYLINTADQHNFLGEALSTQLTSLRDPVFFQFVNRLLWLYQGYYNQRRPYTKEELSFSGVTVKDFEVDEFVTYFDMFEYEVTNGIPMKNPYDYTNYIYHARQYRLNHKPYTFKVTIYSEKQIEGVVRVYIGPKYDSEHHLLNLEQSRMAYMELDHFPVKLNYGKNVIERGYLDSHIFGQEPEGFRSLYTRLVNSINNSEPFYINERNSCGVPYRFQLPRGWKSGQPFVIAVIVSQAVLTETVEEKGPLGPCGTSTTQDKKSLGFPFDRPIEESSFHLSNILFKDVLVYHKERSQY